MSPAVFYAVKLSVSSNRHPSHLPWYTLVYNELFKTDLTHKKKTHNKRKLTICSTRQKKYEPELKVNKTAISKKIKQCYPLKTISMSQRPIKIRKSYLAYQDLAGY